jgi:hypothetical protein
MDQQYKIKDLQTGRFSSFTTLDDIFDWCAEDYVGSSLSDAINDKHFEEVKNATLEYKKWLVEDTYEFKLIPIH